MIIYKVKNKINNKVYIGQTIEELKIRMYKHFSDSKLNRDKSFFHKAIRKYGKNNFEWEVIEECNTKEELNIKEIQYIKLYNSFGENGYNLNYGGDSIICGPLTDEHKKNISDGKKGQIPWNKGIKDYMGANKTSFEKGAIPWNKGLKSSDETKLKLSISHKGSKWSEKRRESYIKNKNKYENS